MLEAYKTLKDISNDTVKQLAEQKNFPAKAVLFAKRLSLRGFHPSNTPSDPIFFEIVPGSLVVAFHFGALVFFNVSEEAEIKFYDNIKPYASKPIVPRLTEVMPIEINPKESEDVVHDTIFIKTADRERFEVIADVLAKSIVLDQFENTIAENFAQVEPIALNLKNKGRLDHSSEELLKHIGGGLLTEYEMVGKIELSEKPMVLWEHTLLENLYTKLTEEFEITERQTILDRKLELLARTAQTSVEVLQHRHANRLEWYIIILILVSIVIELYALFNLPH